MSRDDDDARSSTLVANADSSNAITRDDSLAASPGDLAGAGAGEATPPSTIGRYRLLSRLGAGAMGVVWSAIDPQLERKVAVKLVHPRFASAPEASLRMLREARVMAKLSHRAVVTVHDAGEVDGVLFLAMELIDGETLTARLRRPDLARPDAWRLRLALVIEAGRGLAAAHAKGVLHRDFKPDNVLVDISGRVCVGDFGLATLGAGALNRTSGGFPVLHGDAELTSTGALLGTPVYMSPQQLRGDPADASADQFAFCVAAYEALYGERPFGPTPTGLAAIPLLIDAIESGQLTAAPASTMVPSAVRDVLVRGLAAEPSARWPDMGTLLAALADASGMRARRRRRIAIASLAVAGIAIAAVTGAYVYAHNEPPPPTPQPTTRTLFDVPLQARVALGPGGTTIAVASDRIDVHEPGRDVPWRLVLPVGDPIVESLEVGADEVRFSTRGSSALQHWRFRDAATAAVPPPDAHPPDRMWLADLDGGAVYLDGRLPATFTGLVLVRDGRDVAKWPAAWHDIEVFARSPDGKRFAYVAQHASDGDIHVVAGDGSVRVSSPIHELTALAWLDADTLLVARGTQEHPTISALPITAAGFGPLRDLYHESTGWFTRLAARDGHIVFVDGHPTSRVRILVRKPDDMSVHDYEPSRVAAEIGWSADGELLVWNRITHRVETVRGQASGVDTAMSLPAEPINATAAGELRIVAVRAVLGREIFAIDARTGAVRWHVPDGQLLAIRCVRDREAPCIAIRRAGELVEHAAPPSGGPAVDNTAPPSGGPAVEVLDIDPLTGTLGAVRARLHDVEDVALRADGHMLAVGFAFGYAARELDASGTVVTTYETDLANIRSVAYDADGSILVAGTVGADTYQLDRITNGVVSVLVSSDNEILLLARPSPDGTSVAVVARRYAPVLEELVLP